MSSCHEKSQFCQYICSKTEIIIPEMLHFGMPVSSLPFFFFFFYFIYIKKNPCILNELGKYIQNEIDLQSKSDLYFITGWKFEEMNIIRNKVSRSVSVVYFILFIDLFIFIS